jgi:hypothetical protein
MVDDGDIKKMRSALRQSQRALPIELGLVGLVGGLWWLAQRAIGLPWWGVWIGWVVVGVTAFTAVGDAINVIHLKRRLRDLGADEKKAA